MDSSSPTNNVLQLSIPHLQVVHLAYQRLCGGILTREQLECYYKEDTLVVPSNHFLVTKKIIKIIIKNFLKKILTDRASKSRFILRLEIVYWKSYTHEIHTSSNKHISSLIFGNKTFF